MQASTDSVGQEQQTPLVARMLSNRNFRLVVLVSIAVFELVFIYFIKHFGWLESIDIGTQIAVVTIALLPLITALLVLAGKRFKLSSVFIAFTLFAIFMTFSLRPVWDARNERLAASELQANGLSVLPQLTVIDLEKDIPEFTLFEAETTALPNWIERLIGEELAALPPQDEIVGVQVGNDAQLEILMEHVTGMSQIQAVHFAGDFSEASLGSHASELLRSPVQTLVIGGYDRERECDVEWLKDNKNITSITFLNCPTGITELAKHEIPGIKDLAIWNAGTGTSGDVDWGQCFNSKSFANLKALRLGQGRVSDSEAREISKLQELRLLSISNCEITDFGFLENLPNLRALYLVCDLMTSDELRELKIPKSVKNLTVSIKRRTPDESADWFVEKHGPNRGEVHLHLR
ncbi:MAG: hypothetical protein AB8B55_06950 [Mariniblastus sp.]